MCLKCNITIYPISDAQGDTQNSTPILHHGSY